MLQLSAVGRASATPCVGDDLNLSAPLPATCFGDETYDALAAELPNCLFEKSADDFEHCYERRLAVTCEIGTIIGHYITSTKFLPPLLSGIDAVVCVVIVFDLHGSLSGAVLCYHARDCYMLPYSGADPASLRAWIGELKSFLDNRGADGFRAKCFGVNVLQAEWRLQALACCEEALGHVLDVQHLASSFLGFSPETALEEACVAECQLASCFVKTKQAAALGRHWVQGLLDCARCRSLKSMVARALLSPAASEFMGVWSFVAALAQKAARTGVLIDFNRLNILKQSAAAHRPRTPLLKTIKSNCEHVALACAAHADNRFKWSLTCNSSSGEICSDLLNFPEFSTNVCSRVTVSLPAVLATVHPPAPPFAALLSAADARQQITVLRILDDGQRALVRADNGDEFEASSASIQVVQLVRGEHLSVLSAMVSDYGSCFLCISVPMCPWLFLGSAASSSVIAAFANRRSCDSRHEQLCFDRIEAAACATAAVGNLLSAALPGMAPHKRCLCTRLALSSQRHDCSIWASQLEIDHSAAAAVQCAALLALSELLTGPCHSQHLPYHVVKPSLLGRRAPSADTFVEAALQHAVMSAADLMMLLARESESCMRECVLSTISAAADAAANAVTSNCCAVAHRCSPSKIIADGCFGLVAVLSQSIVFSCRRNFLHSALGALESSAVRLREAIKIDFPYRVAAGHSIGARTLVLFYLATSTTFFAGDLYSWHCPLLHLLPQPQLPTAPKKRQRRGADRAT